MASAVAQAYNGGLGAAPSGVWGQSPWSRGQRSLKLKHLVFRRSMETANLPIFYNLETQKK